MGTQKNKKFISNICKNYTRVLMSLSEVKTEKKQKNYNVDGRINNMETRR